MMFDDDLLQDVIETLESGIALIDGDGRIAACNARWGALLSLPADRPCRGMALADVLTTLDRYGPALPDPAGAQERDRQFAALRNREPAVGELVWKNGRRLHLNGTPLRSGAYLIRVADAAAQTPARRLHETGREPASARTAVDESLKSAGELAGRERQAQRRFIAAASHDLLQPLHAARLFMGSAREDPHMDPKVSSALERADRSIAAANSLLRALLNLSKLEVDGLQPAVSRMEISAMFGALQAEFDPLARARGLELIVLPSKAWVLSDQDLLRSVLQNLVANAIRYTQKGRIVLACRTAGPDHVRLEVRDSGGGIKPEVQQVIFEEFRQVPDRSETTDDGAGLGLAIVKRICEALGHQLMLRSAPGSGSTFSVTLKTSPAGDQPGPARVTGKPLDGLRVLCIEDDRTVEEALFALLTSWGIKPVLTCTADAALALPGDWDAVLATYHLRSGLNGLEVLIRLSDRAARRVLIMDNSDDDVSVIAIRSGIVVMQKPLSPIVLQTFLGHRSDHDRRGLGIDLTRPAADARGRTDGIKA